MDVMETLTPSRAAWKRALADPALHDLPYKIETNEYGQLVMSPVKRIHGRRQFQIAKLIEELIPADGKATIEFAIDTPKGVKVPDVAWLSDKRWDQLDSHSDTSSEAPEICVEVLSGSNTAREIDEKRALYFAAGALEFWTCDASGRMRFFTVDAELPGSVLVPGFPRHISD